MSDVQETVRKYHASVFLIDRLTFMYKKLKRENFFFCVKLSYPGHSDELCFVSGISNKWSKYFWQDVDIAHYNSDRCGIMSLLNYLINF